MIKVNVDMTKCQHYGMCVFEAPNVFKLNDEDKLEYLATAEDSERGNVEAIFIVD
jgi:ferredoxin